MGDWQAFSSISLERRKKSCTLEQNFLLIHPLTAVGICCVSKILQRISRQCLVLAFRRDFLWIRLFSRWRLIYLNKCHESTKNISEKTWHLEMMNFAVAVVSVSEKVSGPSEWVFCLMLIWLYRATMNIQKRWSWYEISIEKQENCQLSDSF